MKKALLTIAALAILSCPASATVWWDTNGTTAGAGATPNGNWSAASATWGSTTGTAAPAVYGADTAIRFSAGTDAANPYTVTVTGTVNVSAMGLEEGPTITMNGGIINFTHAANATSILTGVTTGIPTSAIINSQISSSANVGFKIGRNLGLTNVISISNTSNNWTGPTAVGGDNTLRLLASGVIPDASNVVLTAATAGAVLDVNGFSETVASLTSTSASTSVTLGAGTLTVNAPAANDTFAGVISGATGKLVKNGANTYILTGANTYAGGTTINGGVLQVGNGGTTGVLANGAAATAPIAINGASTILRFNRSDTGSFSQSGVISGTGSVEKLGNHTIRFTNSANTYSGSTTVSGGVMEVDGDATLGDGTGNLNLAGGVLNTTATRTVATVNPINVTANSAITTTSAASNPEFDFSSNTVGGNGTSTLTFRNDGADAATDTFKPRFSGSGFNFANPIVLAAGLLGSKTELNSFNTGATVQTFSGVVSGTGSYRRSASVPGTGGTTEFKADNTYSGGTVVNDGTLLVNNPDAVAGSGTGSGDVTVNASGTLGGSGRIAGNVLMSGTLSPGNSPGSLTIGGNLSLLAGSYKYQIDSTPTATADLTSVSGNLIITAGAVSLDTTGSIGSPLLAMGTKFTLINYGGTWNGGIFTGLPNYYPSLVIGINRFQIRYDDTSAGSNFGGGTFVGTTPLANHWVTITAVPEASTFFVIGLGGVFAFAAVRMGKRLGVNVLNV